MNMQKSVKEFIEILKDSFREQAAASKQAADEIQRFIACVEAQNRVYLPYPPYVERMKPKQYSKSTYWHRIRSNPQRRKHRTFGFIMVCQAHAAINRVEGEKSTRNNANDCGQ